jgi:hypothetical protein
VSGKADEKHSVATRNEGKSIIAGISWNFGQRGVMRQNEPPTNGVHRVRRQLKDTIEHESTALEENVTPVPTIIFHYVVGFRFDPKVKSNEQKSADPSKIV